jgi:hypothetical protein
LWKALCGPASSRAEEERVPDRREGRQEVGK